MASNPSVFGDLYNQVCLKATYHNCMWYYWSFIWMVPGSLIIIYLYFNHQDYTQRDVEDNYLRVSSEKRKKNEDLWDECRKKPLMSTTKTDLCLKIYQVPAIVYYVYDCYLKVATYGLTGMPVCKAAMFTHHFITVIGFVSCIRMKHYPWFICMPLYMHCYLIVMPGVVWLNWLYAVAIACYVIGLNTKPFKYGYLHANILYVSYALIPPLLMIQYFKCSNALDWNSH